MWIFQHFLNIYILLDEMYYDSQIALSIILLVMMMMMIPSE